jgi:methyltransferase-like protein/SAM-dependent methyltransferase
MSPHPPTSYDDIPYLNRAHGYSHPDRAATLAALLGMSPPPVTACRVLELGCANGRNLLPMADQLPGSQFVGVDLSARQIADGQAAVAELGLANLELRHASIMDVDEGYGRFDYIIVHGVYSWVPPEVQDKILAVCRANLSEHGLAYVSYNTLPGWYGKLRVRDMMLHHVRGIADPHTRIQRARNFILMLADLAAPPGQEDAHSPHAAALRAEADIIQTQSDDYVFHEYLEEDNRPIYFHQFAQAAARHGLQYLGDADRGLMAIEAFGQQVTFTLKQMAGDIVEQEQFLDFILNRTFRCSLVCHAGQRLNRSVTGARLRPLFVRANLRPVSAEPDLAGPMLENFQSRDEQVTLAISQPVTKTALALLAEAWPRAIPFEALLAEACARVFAGHELADSPVTLAREAESLSLNLLQTYVHNAEALSLHAHGPCLAARPGPRPTALRSARFEALLAHAVTNAWHQAIHLSTLSWHLLPYLDGSRDRAALIDLVLANSALALEKDGRELTDPAEKRAAAEEKVEACLQGLAEVGLLNA